MARYLLDTNIIIDVLTGRKGRSALLERLLEERHLLATCAIVVSEVYAGMRPAEEAKTAALLDSMEFLPITRFVAKDAGIIRREFATKGMPLAITDATIAAAALAHECILVTANTKDFPSPGLQLYPL